jgi:hypothetical protein
MRRLSIVCSAAVLALGIATAAHADEWNKLTLLTFSGPVDMPGITLPAGTYRFELADPDSGRRVVRVSDQEGSKVHGIFLSMSNQRMEPSEKPVVMFQEAPSGAPQAVKAWFYPGETYGYEFVYPHDQAMKIARATRQPVLSMKDESSPTTTDTARVASMSRAEVSRIDENGRPVSTDAELKESSSQRPTTTAQAATAARPPTAAEPTTAQATTASAASTARPATAPTRSAATARSATAEPTAVGTSGTAGAARGRGELPRTASRLPMLALVGVLAFAAGLGLRFVRTM